MDTAKALKVLEAIEDLAKQLQDVAKIDNPIHGVVDSLGRRLTMHVGELRRIVKGEKNQPYRPLVEGWMPTGGGEIPDVIPELKSGVIKG